MTASQAYKQMEAESLYIEDLQNEIDQHATELQYGDMSYVDREKLINKMKEKRELINKAKAKIKKLERYTGF